MNPRTNTGWVERALSISALAIVYAVVGRLGLMLDAVGGFATLVWPPTGIALAALLLRGRWLWPGILIGAFAVNMSVGAAPWTAAGIAVGNSLEAVAAVTALTLVDFNVRLERVSDVAKLLLFAVLLSTAISATVGVTTLFLSQKVHASELGLTWRAWFLGDVMGDLVVLPVLLIWTERPRAERVVRPRPFELAALASIGAVAGLLVFGGWMSPGRGAQLMYVMFPPMVWAAARFDRRGATAAILAVSAFAIGGTALGHGPFAGDALHRGLIELQSFMAVVSVMVLLLGVAVSERDRAHQRSLEAIRARDDFLSIASHELRTPLSTLVLQLGAIRRQIASRSEPSVQALSDRLAPVERQSDRLHQLVGNLFDVSRVESGQLGIDPTPFDLREVVKDVTGRLEADAERASCTLHVKIDGPARGSWDRLRLEQVLTNMLANAFRHGAGRDVDVRLCTSGDTARIEVEDRGEGIPPEALDDIFTRFHRGKRPREHAGLGLGLYISRHIAEAHGGRLTAASRVGSGATFTLELPTQSLGDGQAKTGE